MPFEYVCHHLTEIGKMLKLLAGNTLAAWNPTIGIQPHRTARSTMPAFADSPILDFP